MAVDEPVQVGPNMGFGLADHFLVVATLGQPPTTTNWA